MEIPRNCQFTRDHLWVRPEGNQAVVGVTDYSQDEMGDVVFLDLPEADSQIEAGSPCGIIESDRAVADLTAPLTGEVIEVNPDLVESPELVNEDPYGEGWLIRVEIAEPDQIEALMTPEEYEDYITDLVQEVE